MHGIPSTDLKVFELRAHIAAPRTPNVPPNVTVVRHTAQVTQEGDTAMLDPLLTLTRVPEKPDLVLDDWPLEELAEVIERAWDAGPGAVHPSIVHDAVDIVIDGLDTGELRVAERHGVGQW